MESRFWVDELVIYDAGDNILAQLAKGIEEGSNGKAKSAPVTVAQDVKDVFEFYTNLRQITFYTHGTPGRAWFGKTSFGSHDVLTSFNSHPALFAHGEGRVLFAGCNVGDKDIGRVFLVCVGQKLLRGRGGIVGASKNKTFFSNWFEIRQSGFSDLQMFRLDANGNVVADKVV